PTWSSLRAKCMKTRSPACNSVRGIGEPARNCSSTVRGKRIPALLVAYTTRPLQSKPPGAAPPYRYGWPSMAVALSTIIVLGLGKARVTFASGVVGGVGLRAGIVEQAARERAKPAMTAAVLMHATPSWSMGDQRSRQGRADDARLRAQRPDAQKRFAVQLMHEFFRLFGDTAA